MKVGEHVAAAAFNIHFTINRKSLAFEIIAFFKATMLCITQYMPYTSYEHVKFPTYSTRHVQG